MIVRQNLISPTAEEVSLRLSFSLPDVRKSLQRLFMMLKDNCSVQYALNAPLTEFDLKHFFQQDLFPLFKEKYIEQLSSWALAVAIRHQYIFSSESEDETKKIFFLSEKLRNKHGKGMIFIEDD